MNNSRFNDKTVIITGASSGIGRAIALAYASEAANVVVNYCNSKNKAKDVVREIEGNGGSAIAIQGDMSIPEDIQSLVADSQHHFDSIDVWINNAGADILTGTGAVLSIEEKLQRLIDVDLKGTMNACWAIAPEMKARGKGVIINTSWDLATHGFEGINPQVFSATKAGILGFSRSLALSYAPQVRVNILAPGWIQTAFAEEDMSSRYHQARIREIPLARFGTPEDVANVALYLGSDDAAYLTGEVINVNGGLI